MQTQQNKLDHFPTFKYLYLPFFNFKKKSSCVHLKASYTNHTNSQHIQKNFIVTFNKTQKHK